MPGGKHQAPAGNYAISRIDNDRKHEAELLDALGELADLRGGVFAALSAERL